MQVAQNPPKKVPTTIQHTQVAVPVGSRGVHVMRHGGNANLACVHFSVDGTKSRIHRRLSQPSSKDAEEHHEGLHVQNSTALFFAVHVAAVYGCLHTANCTLN